MVGIKKMEAIFLLEITNQFCDPTRSVSLAYLLT
jgi:hypothetical protein